MKIGINVLFITYDRGGSKTYILNLLKNLIHLDKKNQYYLFIAGYNKNLFESYKNQLYIIEIPMKKYNTLLRFLMEQIYLPILARKYKIDLLFSPGNMGIIFTPIKQILVIHALLIFSKLKKKSKIKRSNPFIENFRKILIIASIRKANRIIVVSDFTKKCLKNEFYASKNKIKVISEGVDSEHFQKIPSDTCKTKEIYGPYILSVGILFRYKNIDKIIQAFSILKKTKKIPHSLVIVGRDHNNNLKYLETLTENLGLGKWVYFRKQISYETLPVYYKYADLFVFPSQIESFGLPTLESMASGTPVIASNRTSIPEIVGDAGLIVNPDNINELANAIFEVLKNKKLREKLIQKGSARVKDFSWEKTAQQTLKVFKEVMESNS